MDDDHAADWAKFVGLHRTNNLFDADTNKLFTQHDMDNYAVTLAPAHMRGKPAAREWADDLMQTWPALTASIPKAVTDAACAPTQIEVEMYVAFTPEEDDKPTYYARVEPGDSNQPFKYHIQKLDTFGTPHDTGSYVSSMAALRTPIAPAVLWIESGAEDAHYTFQSRSGATDADEEEDPPKLYIAVSFRAPLSSKRNGSASAMSRSQKSSVRGKRWRCSDFQRFYSIEDLGA